MFLKPTLDIDMFLKQTYTLDFKKTDFVFQPGHDGGVG